MADQAASHTSESRSPVESSPPPSPPAATTHTDTDDLFRNIAKLFRTELSQAVAEFSRQIHNVGQRASDMETRADDMADTLDSDRRDIDSHAAQLETLELKLEDLEQGDHKPKIMASTAVTTNLPKVCAVDVLVASGSSILIIVAMPHFNMFTNITILSSVHLVPSIIQIFIRLRKKKWKLAIAIISAILCISGHIVSLVMFIVEDKSNEKILFFIIAILGTLLVSCNWFENFLPQKDAHCEIKPDQDERNVLYFYGSIVRIVVTWIVVIIYIWTEGEEVWATIKSASSNEQRFILSLFGIQAVSSALCHWFGVVACKMRNVKLGFYIPLTLSELAVIIFNISFYYFKYTEMQTKTEIQTFNVSYFCYNDLLVDNNTMVESLLLEVAHHTCQIIMKIDTLKYVIASGILWYAGSICANLPVYRLKVQRIERTTQLFVRRLYEAPFIDQSMLLNIRTKLKKTKSPDDDDNNNRDLENLMVYLCATMWHETYDEMLKILTSIFRLDKYKSMMSNDTFSFETHIYFDDAFVDNSHDSKRKRITNSYVQFLVTVIEEVYSVFTRNKNQVFHHANTSERRTQTIMSTPYGERLCYKLPCGNLLYVHLKDKKKIRHKKRWSQIMYMYYLLGWKMYRKYALLSEQNPGQQKNIEKELLKAKSNTYILALDGDTDFQPSSLMLLIDRLKMYTGVGAACGRIHPTGIGPMVWYQKFEYAVGHWLQKSSEHVFGCVLCSPGCFSLFRASALMDDNVLKKYSKKATEAIEYIQYDQGEDRWLCTLLLQQGWRVEYNAASDAYTNAPQVFDEFYNQRRRWSPSTMANTLDLLNSGKQTSKKNPSISYLYVIYQILTMASSILSPATVCLMIAGSLSFLFQWDPNGSILVAIIPPAFFTLVCYIAKPSTQIKIAACLSICYVFLMMATFLSIIGDLVRQQTFMTPTGLFLISMSIIYVITALLHPQEFSLLIYGLVYILCVPSGYLLLTIYSLVNMHIVSWGTRETVAPKDKNKQSTKRVRYQNTCKCLCWNIELKVHDSKCEVKEEKSDTTDDQIKIVDAKREHTENEYETEESHVTEELNLERSYSVLEEETLEEEEKLFWEGVIQQYLKPIEEDSQEQARIQSELKSLRNKVTFIIFMINLLWIVATFFLQIIGSTVHIALPKVYINGTYSESEKLYMDPIGLMFLLSFALLLISQFVALLYHRIFTFIHFIAYKKKNERKSTKQGTTESSNHAIRGIVIQNRLVEEI
ncbi:chitin synthase chs-2-like [Rhinoderma darwinii]|uniref:chitin synthase chs-2-like n=1 Tax=Rhinoderma darwinii TaxID=43563 RepID=UPI003F66BF1F